MNAEDNLKYFYDSIMSSLTEKNEEELSALKEHLSSDMDEFRKKTEADSFMEERLHRDETKRELMKQISLERLTLRRARSEKEAEIKEKLFEEVSKLLEDYRKTPEYTDTLCGMIKAARGFAGEDKLDIYICPSDRELLETLKERTGAEISVSDVPFAGGIQAAIPGRNIFINSSFSSRLEDEKQRYIVRP